MEAPAYNLMLPDTLYVARDRGTLGLAVYRLPGLDGRLRWRAGRAVARRIKQVTDYVWRADLLTLERVKRKRVRSYGSFRLYIDGREVCISERKLRAKLCPRA